MQFNNLKIGHTTHPDKGTGLSVFLFDQPATCGYWLCGSAPATRDIVLLDPANTVSEINALLFTGGSAYGLDAAQGVMQWLSEQNRGFATAYGPVPIVPTASIYDFGVNGMAMPTAEDAYLACTKAKAGSYESGRIGAGTGASVGKLFPHLTPMTGGFGCAQFECVSGVSVLACVVVNPIGNVITPQGKVMVGACNAAGKLVDTDQLLSQGHAIQTPLSQQNTTLAAIFTNAQFSKIELTRIAKMATAGLAQAINPVFTSLDGDIVFAISTGHVKGDEITVGHLAAKVISQAIRQAVAGATILK